ncbi:MAG: hypothetical protein WB687_13420 [Candidatus Cybelea sp.]
MAREAVKPAGDERTPIALESEGKPGVLHAKENETIGCSESAGALVVENEQNLSEEGMLYNERR